MSDSGHARRGVRGLVGIAVALVAVLVATPAGAAPRSAPDALPQLWAVQVDGATLPALGKGVVRRLRQERVAVIPAGKAKARRKVIKRARKAKLQLFVPRVSGDAGATCATLARARPAGRCGIRARSRDELRALVQSGVADLAVFAPRKRRGFGHLDDGSSTTRVLGVLPLANRSFKAKAWRKSVGIAAKRSLLDLAVRPKGKHRRQALRRFLAVLDNHGPKDRTAPGGPRGKLAVGGAASAVRLGWKASKARDIRAYGIYRDGRRIGYVKRKARAARVNGIGCGGGWVGVDAVDRAGNRSAKRVKRATPDGCGSTPARPRGAFQPGADGWQPTLAPGYDVPATRFVSTNGSDGGDCTAAAPCASFMRAYQVAGPGEVVDVAGGTYGGQTLNEVGGRAAPSIAFRPAQGQRVILDGLSIDGADHVTLAGFETTYRNSEPGAGNQEGIWAGPGSTYVVFEDIDAGNVHTWFADHVFVAGGDYGPCHAVWGSDNICGNSKLDVSTNVTIDGATFHDFRFDETCFTVSGADCHWECMYVNGSQNTTIRNSRFRGCAIFDIFTTISGDDARDLGHKNLTIENNWFGTSWTEGPGNSGEPAMPQAVSPAWCQNSPHGYSDVKIRFNSFEYNASVEIDSNPSCVFDNVRVYGNLMMWNNCQDRWNMQYNVWGTSWRTGSCSPTDRIAGPRFPYVNGTQGPNMDFHLAGGATVADNLVPVAAGCPATDIDGQPRGAGGFCDAGADER